MVILVTSSSRAKECAAAIEQMTHRKTQVATSLARAVDFLQTHDYDVLVLDESFHQTEVSAANLLLDHAGPAMPVYVNLALHGAERVAREVQTGLLRLVREKLAAMQSAENVLRNELRGDVTGILLNSELALREPSLSEGIAERIHVLHELAENMRLKLEGASAAAPTEHAQAPFLGTREFRPRAH